MSRSEEDGLQKIRKMLSSLQDAHKRLETQVLGMNRTVQESTKRLSTIDTALEDIQVRMSVFQWISNLTSCKL